MERQHVYFLGIGGTLVGSLALLAKEKGFHVTGCDDKPLYPPMSDQLSNAGIEVYDAFDKDHLKYKPDYIVVGNAGLKRSHVGIEYLLRERMTFYSAAQWLGEVLLPNRWVIAAAGTHGKTTVASMLAWIIEYAGVDVGFLIGGVPANFGVSAKLGRSPYFVVEADEYDTSYFDRRSKFVHYWPKTLVINNLEYDHADIFPNIEAIMEQFHILLRTIPEDGLVVAPHDDPFISQVLQKGCWSDIKYFVPMLEEQTDLPSTLKQNLWYVKSKDAQLNGFSLHHQSEVFDMPKWEQMGVHNINNAVASVIAAGHIGIAPDIALEALASFKGVARRMSLVGSVNDGQITVYDDFAHHPTAIELTLDGVRKKYPNDYVLAVIEPRTHTMSLGTLRDALVPSTVCADYVFWFQGENIRWDVASILPKTSESVRAQVLSDINLLVAQVLTHVAKINRKIHIVIMSNGSFSGFHQKLYEALQLEVASKSG